MARQIIWYKLVKYQSCHHVETSQLICSVTSELICSANQLTGFYRMATLAFNELRSQRNPKLLYKIFTQESPFKVINFAYCLNVAGGPVQGFSVPKPFRYHGMWKHTETAHIWVKAFVSSTQTYRWYEGQTCHVKTFRLCLYRYLPQDLKWTGTSSRPSFEL